MTSHLSWIWLAMATPAMAQEPAPVPEAPAPPPAEVPAPAETPAPTGDAPVAPEPPVAPPPPKVQAAPSKLPPPPPRDELPIPTLTIDRIPPSSSYEFAVQVSYGQVAYHRATVGSWVGFGFRGAWGKNFGIHRLGFSGTLTSEGDLGIHTLLAFEPKLEYDVVTPGGLLLGAGAGPALMYWADASSIDVERDFGAAPAAAARVGWSQTWSRIGRRIFVFAEPKVRYVQGEPDVLVAVAVGSGQGR